MSIKRARVLGLGKEIFKDDTLEQNHPLDGFVYNDEARILDLSLTQIFPNPEQPRKFFEEEALRDLSESIKQHGILQPIIVQEKEEGFMIVAGERRFRATKMAGLVKIPALIKSDNPLEISIIENIQRENLKPLEEAEGLKLLADRFKYTHENLAKIIGKSRSSITEILSLNRLPEQIKNNCRTSDNLYSKSLLLQIVKEGNEQKMFILWEKVKKGAFSVKQVQEAKKDPKGTKSTTKGCEYKFIPSENDFSLTIRFKKSEVDKEDIRLALEKTVNDFIGKYGNINLNCRTSDNINFFN